MFCEQPLHVVLNLCAYCSIALTSQHTTCDDEALFAVKSVIQTIRSTTQESAGLALAMTELSDRARRHLTERHRTTLKGWDMHRKHRDEALGPTRNFEVQSKRRRFCCDSGKPSPNQYRLHSSRHRLACLAPHKTFPRSGDLVARSLPTTWESVGILIKRSWLRLAAVG
ncbi:hypothetical protein DE146DRAFT_228536 [Phaeosphaeria sp. MPI-PUGE-AT-0046c]|nr:hypothetical protein DE146DRAFT_228536 [Phaeosphaeria sp. MPI-PUGE-AT-0046c]